MVESMELSVHRKSLDGAQLLIGSDQLPFGYSADVSLLCPCQIVIRYGIAADFGFVGATRRTGDATRVITMVRSCRYGLKLRFETEKVNVSSLPRSTTQYAAEYAIMIVSPEPWLKYLASSWKKGITPSGAPSAVSAR
jgi:hypothetical protein